MMAVRQDVRWMRLGPASREAGFRLAPFPLHAVVAGSGEILIARNPFREEGVDPRAAYLVTHALERAGPQVRPIEQHRTGTGLLP